MKTFAKPYLIVISMLVLIASETEAQKHLSPSELKENYHQFDFWLGEWDVYAYGTEKLVGKSHIMSINDSTGLLENYETTQSTYKGKSLNMYNSASGKWQQFWIDNGGTVLSLEGEYSNQKMILESHEGNSRNRISWEKLKDHTVRQTWKTSSDSGLTWQVVFDGIYKKRP